MEKFLLRSTLFFLIALFLLTACGNKTISTINIDFNSMDSIRIQTTEQVERSIKDNKIERYEMKDQNQVTNFIKMLGSAQKLKKAKTPFALGDGVITLVSNGSNIYGFRYYKEKNQLLDLHEGILYQFPDGLVEILNNLNLIPETKL